METLDLLLYFIYFFFIIVLSLIIKQFNSHKKYFKYLIPGLIIKLFSTLVFLSVYIYYYGYGDTFGYLVNGAQISDILTSKPLIGLKMLFQEANSFESDTYIYTSNIPYFNWENSNLTVAKFASIFHVFTFNSWLTTSLLFSWISYLGLWKLFIALRNRYPEIEGRIAIAVLFVPSVIFWSSGVMKDTIVIGALGYLFAEVDKVFIRRKLSLRSSLIILITSYLITLIKVYVFIGILPAIAIWIVFSFKDSIGNKVIRNLIAPFVFITSIVAVVSITFYLGEFYEDYSIENFAKTAENYQSNHYKGENSQIVGTRSGYTLGKIDPTIFGLISKVPASIVVTFFRPYLWEVKNIVMLLSALESFIVTILTIRVLIKLRPIKFFKIIFSDSFLLMAISFSLFFGFAVGFSSYNFGALVRYKIPCLPFYLSSLFILEYHINKHLKTKRLKFSKY